MNLLKSRKQLLVAESELNRAQLVQELQTLKDEVHSLANKARTASSLASVAVSLVAGIASFRREKSAPAAEKSSWPQTILKVVQLAGSLWSEFHARPKP
jgi:hypothetical protein